jgi:hypothetical protein
MESSLHARDIREVRASTRSQLTRRCFFCDFVGLPKSKTRLEQLRSRIRGAACEAPAPRSNTDAAEEPTPPRAARSVVAQCADCGKSICSNHPSPNPTRRPGRRVVDEACVFLASSTTARLNLLMWQMPPFAATNPNKRFCTLPSRHGFRWCGTISRAGFLFPSPLRHPVSPRMRPGLLSDMVLV